MEGKIEIKTPRRHWATTFHVPLDGVIYLMLVTLIYPAMIYAALTGPAHQAWHATWMIVGAFVAIIVSWWVWIRPIWRLRRDVRNLSRKKP